MFHCWPSSVQGPCMLRPCADAQPQGAVGLQSAQVSFSWVEHLPTFHQGHHALALCDVCLPNNSSRRKTPGRAGMYIGKWACLTP